MEGQVASGTKGRLTRDLICQAALEAIDETGLESLSMRSLGATLGVKASSLYHHFESKDDLLTGVSEFLFRKLGRPPSGGDWTEQVRGTFLQLRDFIQSHPNAAPLLVRDLAHSPVAMKRAGVLVRLISRAGLGFETSAIFLSNLVALLVGHTYLGLWVREEAGSQLGPRSEEEAGDGAWRGDLTPGPDGYDGSDGLDGPETWVHALFPALVSGGGAGRMEVAGARKETILAVEEGGDAEQELRLPGGAAARLAAAGLTGADDLADDGAFVAGIDAVIRGFTSG